MGEHRSARRNALSPSAIAKIDRLCHKFESDWLAGKTAVVVDYIAGSSESGRSVLLHELVLLEWTTGAGQARWWGRVPMASDFPITRM